MKVKLFKVISADNMASQLEKWITDEKVLDIKFILPVSGNEILVIGKV